MNISDFQSQVTGSIVGLECIADSPCRFDGNINKSCIGDLTVCHIHAGQHAVVRRPSHLDRDGLVLTSVVSGSCSLERSKDHFEFSLGQAFFCRSKEFYVIETSKDINLRSLFIPYEKLGVANRVLLDDLNASFAPQISADIYSLLTPFLNLNAHNIKSKGVQGHLETSLLGLISAALDGEERGSRRTCYILRELLNLVEAHLTDECLSPAFVAERMGYSQRYLNKLLKVNNLSLLKIIHQRRMEKIISELVCDEFRAEPIYAISGKYCFYDNSHFSRQFKAYTGLSPKAYRQKKCSHIHS